MQEGAGRLCCSPARMEILKGRGEEKLSFQMWTPSLSGGVEVITRLKAPSNASREGRQGSSLCSSGVSRAMRSFSRSHTLGFCTLPKGLHMDVLYVDLCTSLSSLFFAGNVATCCWDPFLTFFLLYFPAVCSLWATLLSVIRL